MRLLRWPEVRALVPFSRSTVTRLEQSGAFPRRLRLSPNVVGWVDTEIQSWLERHMEEASRTSHRGR